MKKYVKPRHFDQNLIIIGAGSAGLTSAYLGAALRAKVTLIEKNRMGGDCLNTGCVPSKALIRSAKILALAKRAETFGFNRMDVDFDFARVMERSQRIIKTIAPHDSMERYTNLGVDCIHGEAKITTPYSVEVNGRTLTTRNIIIATGSSPVLPSITGIERVGYLTTDTIWDIRTLPNRLVVLGGGPVGCELSQCFRRFGSKVTLVEMQPRIMYREDPDVSDIITGKFMEEGIKVMTNHRVISFSYTNKNKNMICMHDGEQISIEFDELLLASGRKPDTGGFGLEDLGIPLHESGGIKTDGYLQTAYPSIYACGDVTGSYQFTHMAAHQAWYAVFNSLFGGLKKLKADMSIVPWATFTEPEVARVGLNETEAAARQIPCEITHYGIDELDRSIVDDAAVGFVKVLTVPGKDQILGATIVGEHAGELIGEYISAMRHGLGLNKILATIHIYPTMAEANKYAAGLWRRQHTPDFLLWLVERFHEWRRG